MRCEVCNEGGFGPKGLPIHVGMKHKGARPSTRVQFGDDGIRLVEVVPSLTVERLAAMLHEATAGCYEDDRCLEPEHRFRPSGTVHTFDAGTLLPMLAPYLHRAPSTERTDG